MTGRSVKDLIVELLQRGLADRDQDRDATPARVQLPLLVGSRRPGAGEEMTSDRVAELLVAAEAEALDPGGSTCRTSTSGSP